MEKTPYSRPLVPSRPEKPEPIKAPKQFSNPYKSNPSLPNKSSSNSLPKNTIKKEHPFLFPGSFEYVKGRGGLEEDLTIILRTEPDKLAKLNKQLQRYRFPSISKNDIPEAVKEMLERRFSPEVLRNN